MKHEKAQDMDAEGERPRLGSVLRLSEARRESQPHENHPKYVECNRAKATFDEDYNLPTPHAYLSRMRRLGYQIGEQARPYCIAAAEFIASEGPTWPVQMLDIGCSYGIGSAFVRSGCSFEELVSFFESRAPERYYECVAATRAWLNVVAPSVDMRVVGLDASENALRFALNAGLLDKGICRNLEERDLSGDEQDWLRGCNLLICTGAVGYVGKPTFRRILEHVGRDHPAEVGPLAVLTILRMFDPSEVSEAFREAGYEFERVDGVHLPQRAFANESERRSIVEQVQAKGLETADLEERGALYADLFIAGRAEMVSKARGAMESVARSAPIFSRQVEVANSGA